MSASWGIGTHAVDKRRYTGRRRTFRETLMAYYSFLETRFKIKNPYVPCTCIGLFSVSCQRNEIYYQTIIMENVLRINWIPNGWYVGYFRFDFWINADLNKKFVFQFAVVEYTICHTSITNDIINPNRFPSVGRKSIAVRSRFWKNVPSTCMCRKIIVQLFIQLYYKCHV